MVWVPVAWVLHVTVDWCVMWGLSSGFAIFLNNFTGARMRCPVSRHRFGVDSVSVRQCNVTEFVTLNGGWYNLVFAHNKPQFRSSKMSSSASHWVVARDEAALIPSRHSW